MAVRRRVDRDRVPAPPALRRARRAVGLLMRVAVVGAGFAGLAAAELLARNGVEVVVLEARDRVGGRVWSRRLENGAVVEMGAEFILPGADTLHGLVDAVRARASGTRGCSTASASRAEGSGSTRCSSTPRRRPIAAALSERPRGALGISARTFLDGLDLDPGAREAIEARLEISCVSTVDRIDAGALGGLAAHSHDACPSIAGGNQSLALALAERLGPAVQLRAAG